MKSEDCSSSVLDGLATSAGARKHTVGINQDDSRTAKPRAEERRYRSGISPKDMTPGIGSQSLLETPYLEDPTTPLFGNPSLRFLT